jgi:hypothetical protein
VLALASIRAGNRLILGSIAGIAGVGAALRRDML